MPTDVPSRPRQPRMPIEARREQVLDAALHLIVTRGYAAVSMESIAREAQLSKPVVYNAYPRLADLLPALLDREDARAFGALAAAVPDPSVEDDAAARLIHWLRSLVAAISEHPDTWRLLLLQPDETPEIVRGRMRAGRRLALDQLRALIQALPARGAGLGRLDVELAAEALLAVAEHCARLLLVDANYTPERLMAFAEQLMHAFLHLPAG